MFFSKAFPLALILASGVWAQFDMAQCPSGFDWNKNSLSQDPCMVGSMLDASCRGLAQYTYPPLNATQYYLPPRSNHSGDVTCDCNTVMYSLYMACAACQGGQIYSWTQWIPQCSSGVFVAQYPVDIAQGTAVPYWAYYNITSLPNQTWNDTVSKTVGRDPEQTPKQINTVGSGHSSVPKTATSLPGSTGTPKSGKNVGAIVGGVVGTIVPLSILAVCFFFYMRHRRNQPQPMPIPPTDSDPYGQRPTSYGPPPMSNAPFTPYNPSDPSTFPTQDPPNSVTYTTQPPNARGGYSGVAEV